MQGIGHVQYRESSPEHWVVSKDSIKCRDWVYNVPYSLIRILSSVMHMLLSALKCSSSNGYMPAGPERDPGRVPAPVRVHARVRGQVRGLEHFPGHDRVPVTKGLHKTETTSGHETSRAPRKALARAVTPGMIATMSLFRCQVWAAASHSRSIDSTFSPLVKRTAVQSDMYVITLVSLDSSRTCPSPGDWLCTRQDLPAVLGRNASNNMERDA